MALALPPPATPGTPVDLFSALALTPYIAPTVPSTIPSLRIEPPSDSGSTASAFSECSTISLRDLLKPLASRKATPDCRELTLAEAKQIISLIHEHLGPVRASPKGFMRESISLSEKLHEAGIKRDRQTRIMGLHLRAIWEDMQKLMNGRASSSALEQVYAMIQLIVDNWCRSRW